MKYFILIRRSVFLLILVTIVVGCDSWGALQDDPNNPTISPPSSILTGLLLDMQEDPWGYTMRHNQFYVLTNSYYGNQDYLWEDSDFNYDSLRDVLKMEEEAARTSTVDSTMNPYFALGKFFRAHFFIADTRDFGDIPMSEALKGNQGIYKPGYDPQKKVYAQCLKWLKQANNQIANIITASPEASISGDIYFGGDLNKWQKVINSYRLRVLVSLSHHANDPDLNVKQQFADIVNNPDEYPLISSNEDNLQIEWLNNKANRYPLFEEMRLERYQGRYPLGATYIDLLVNYRDPRLFIVALPTDSARNNGDADFARDFSSYKGGDTGALQADLKKRADNGKLSYFNPDWFWSTTGEPTILLGWPEVEFSIAEAINRGWVSGDASKHYRNGIRASMQHYKIENNEITDYFSQSGIHYVGDNAEGLEQILKQKYISFFQNSGWEAFYNQRRTGVPEFAVGPANQNNNLIPMRWKYPEDEYFQNTENVNAAVKQQYGGSDDINAQMWLLQ